MLINLTLNSCKANAYNQQLAKIKGEYPGLFEDERRIKRLDDKFIPYANIDIGNMTQIEVDYRSDFDGVYVCALNSDHDIGRLTDYEVVKNFDSPIYFCHYGVCDNASQVLDYYDSLHEQNKDYMSNRNFVILLHPFFREDQPESGGWRWHKWGEYIGKFDSKCEYLYDEDGIGFVYAFSILEIKPCKAVNGGLKY